MAMKLKAELMMASSMNVRREKAGKENGSIGVDIKFHGELPLEDIRGLFSTDVAFKQLESLYLENGELVTGDFSEQALAIEGINVTAIITSVFESKKLKLTHGSGFNQISVKLLAGRKVDFSARLQVHPSKEDRGELGELLNTTVKLNISAQQLELLEEDQAETDQQQQLLDAPVGAKKKQTPKGAH